MKFKLRHADTIAWFVVVILMVIFQQWWGALGFIVAACYRWALMVKKDVEEGNGGISRSKDPYWV